MGCCTSRFLSVPEQALNQAEETLALYKLSCVKTITTLEPYCKKATLTDVQVSQILTSLQLPSTGLASAFYNNLRGQDSEVSYRRLLTAFTVCSYWDENQKAKVLFEVYADLGEKLTPRGAAEMVEDIYSLTIECLPSIVDDPYAGSYVSFVAEFKIDVKRELVTTLFREVTDMELDLSSFQAKFAHFKVKFLCSTDARASFRRYATVQHALRIRDRANTRQIEQEANSSVAVVGETS